MWFLSLKRKPKGSQTIRLIASEERAYAKVSQATLYKRMQDGTLGFSKLRGRTFIDTADLDAIFERVPSRKELEAVL